MGTSSEGETGDPATDDRARYDYEGGRVERPEFLADLRARVDGDVRFGDLTRQFYATGASAYEVTPVGVVFPKSTADVAGVVSYCAERETPVLPRGGGTSLAGQAVNEAVVLDFSRHMESVRSVDPDRATARAEVGVTLGALNDRLESHGLKFAPDPAWGDKSVLGGAIGNNSTGSHSLKYGKTDAYVEECEVVLADGTVTTFGEVSLDELHERTTDGSPDETGNLEARIYDELARIVDEEAEAVENAFPDLKRNVSGYNLDCLLAEAQSGSVNLARLLAGSEGTLAIVTEATVTTHDDPDGVEPADAITFQADCPDLLTSTDAGMLAAHAYGLCEYLDYLDLDDHVASESPTASLRYHGHCHQKAHRKDHHAVGVLRRAGYDVDPLDSACCGMAGSFGYETEHYSMSQAIGTILFQQVQTSPGERVVTPGASCRTQLGDRPRFEQPPHTVETLPECVPEQ